MCIEILHQKEDKLQLIRKVLLSTVAILHQLRSAEEEVEICLWTSNPNQGLDRDTLNDVFCQSYETFYVESILPPEPPSFTWSIAPNPVVEVLNIECGFPFSATSNLTIYNNKGEVLLLQELAEGEDTFTVDVSSLPKGIYYVAIKQENFSEVQKFVK